jgi:hypothetical protein
VRKYHIYRLSYPSDAVTTALFRTARHRMFDLIDGEALNPTYSGHEVLRTPREQSAFMISKTQVALHLNFHSHCFAVSSLRI